jgi:hypothetical protein
MTLLQQNKERRDGRAKNLTLELMIFGRMVVVLIFVYSVFLILMVVMLIFSYYGVLDLDDYRFVPALLCFLCLPVCLVTCLRGCAMRDCVSESPEERESARIVVVYYESMRIVFIMNR